VQTCLGLGGNSSSTLVCSSSAFSPLFAIKALFVSIRTLHAANEILLTENIEIGTHGIIIDFTDGKGNNYNATYLPEVAVEQGNRTHLHVN
jgi:AMMECR1 domain-containing protein